MPVTSVTGPVGRIHVDDGGAGGLPVVFVHSYAGNTSHWSRQLAHLRGTRRAIALDLRGHGESATPVNHDYAIESLAQDIDAVADSLALRRFVLVGHSLGGAAALAFAAAHPDRVAGLILAGTPGKLPAEQANKMMGAMSADFDKTTEGIWTRLTEGAQPAVKTQIMSEMRSVPREASLVIMRNTFDFDPLPAIANYPGPKLAVVTGLEQPHDLHKLVPNLPHKRIEGTSHWPHMDKPDEFNRILDEFLAALK